jgi:hypothetical protein
MALSLRFSYSHLGGIMEKLRSFLSHRIALLIFGAAALPVGTASATVVTLDVNGYGYNTISGGLGADGLAGAIGCGPTTGTMIMEYYSRHGASGLISSNPLADARLMGAGPNNPINTSVTYMNTNAAGNGPSFQFQVGFESFAAFKGYDFNAAIHVAGPLSGYQGSSGWNMYTFSGPNQNIFGDANFWNTTTWQIDPTAFISFIKAELDAGRPLSASVYGDPNSPAGTVLDTGSTNGGATHWMPIVGYDDVNNKWAGYNTWDGTLHWYDATSAFYDTDTTDATMDVPNMSIAYLRTFNFNGPINQSPEPATIALFGLALVGVAASRRRKQ